MVIEQTSRPEHLLPLNKEGFLSYDHRKEEYIRRLLPTTTQELTSSYPFISRYLPAETMQEVARIFLCGKFAGQEMLSLFTQTIHAKKSEADSLTPEMFPITINPNFFPHPNHTGLANPTFVLENRHISLFDLSPRAYNRFINRLSEKDLQTLKVQKVDISLNIFSIMEQLSYLPVEQVEKDCEEGTAHEIGHALFFLSTNTNLKRRIRLMHELQNYPHLSHLYTADPTIMQRYYDHYLEKQARLWEGFFARQRGKMPLSFSA